MVTFGHVNLTLTECLHGYTHTDLYWATLVIDNITYVTYYLNKYNINKTYTYCTVSNDAVGLCICDV